MFTTKITKAKKFIEGTNQAEPSIFIHRDAMTKMSIIIEQSAQEVGWLGVVERDGYNFTITDVLILEQEVSATTADIKEEGLENLAMELINADRINDVVNIRLWGHSHVNMAVSPSGTDDATMRELSANNEYFIRFIGNKRGEMNLALFDYDRGIAYEGLNWEVIAEEGSASFLKQLEINAMTEEYYEKLETLLEEKLELEGDEDGWIKPYIAEELNQKVTKRTYSYARPKGRTLYDDWEVKYGVQQTKRKREVIDVMQDITDMGITVAEAYTLYGLTVMELTNELNITITEASKLMNLIDEYMEAE